MSRGSLAIGLPLTLVGAGVIAFGWWIMARSIAFVARALPATAEVVALERSESSIRRRDENPATARTVSYLATLRYRDRTGETWVERSRRGVTDPGFEVGDTIAVLYLPDDPAWVEVDTEESPLAAFGFFALVGLLFGSIGAWQLVAGRRWRLRRAR
ncbi:MAG: DUF3592 domain-containing protein [Pseudomonadota bacterium]